MKRVNAKLLSLILIIIMIVIVVKISYESFINYENTVINQQKKYLLTISKSIGRSLELYVKEKETSLQALANHLEFYIESEDGETLNKTLYRSLSDFYIAHKKEVSSLIYLDLKNGNTSFYPNNVDEKNFILNSENFETEVQNIKDYLYPFIGKHYLDRNGEFSFNILIPIITKGMFRGILLGNIKLSNMHELLVKPVRAGDDGYAVVKDGYGNILMHPVKDQIGYDGINLRKEKYPNLDYSDIEKLFKKQQEEQEGSFVYYSYWWPKDKLERVKKINVYSRIYITDDYWIIPVLTSYSEIRKPIMNYLYSLTFISTVIILVFSWLIFLTIRIVKNKENYELETKYLKEINKNTEELRIKDAELHHKRKLETIGTLAGGIAHEFNNALTPIMGYSEMCLRELSPDYNSYNYVRSIHRAAKRAQDIINQIRVFSGDKNIKLKYTVTSSYKILSEAVSFVESIMPSDIKIMKEFNKNSGNIYANETQIHQMILNLCTNAQNAMKEQKNGVLKIVLKSIIREDDQWLKNNTYQERNYIKISIEDTGCGIEEEALHKIFEPFFTKKLSEKSSGLGLAIVSQIVNKHGGVIRVQSKVNKGSRFDIYLPKSEKAISLSQTQENFILQGKEKVLVVDNDEAIAKMLQSGLTELGYKTSSIINDGEILKEFNYIKAHYQIVVTDLTMPEVNGIQFAKKLKEANPNIKVILMTAYSNEPLEEYMKLKIIDKYLMKPVTAEQISKNIRKIMDNDK